MRFMATISGLVVALAGSGALAFDGGSDPTLPRRPSEPASASGGSSSPDCNPVAAAIIGGIFGALISEKNRGQGAAIGAGIAAAGCAAINAISRQTKSAEVVEAAYVEKHGQLPPAPRVEEYKAGLSSTVVAAGKELKTRSTARVVNGTATALQEISEEIQLDLRQANGGQLLQNRKKLTESGTPGSGEWVNEFTVALPPGTQQGKYPLALTLYVNGQPVSRRTGSLQIAEAGEVRSVLLAQR